MATKKIQDKRLAEAYLAKLDISRIANKVDPFETKTTQNARIERAKNDIVFMVETYLPHYATADCAPFQIEAANDIANDPFIIEFEEWFRGGAKSVWGNIIIPLWLWMRGEDVFMCLMSDSVERAQELLSDVQSELEGNPLIIHDFGSQKCEGSWEFGNFFTTDQRFIGKAFGIKKKVRGVRIKQRRPNLWVIDDLETPDTISNPKRMRKQADQIERDIIPTMTDKKRRRMLYLNNRFARVMTQTILQERHPDWKVRQVKAYNKVTYEPAWPSMYTAEYYKQQEKNMGIPAAYAEYLHETKLEGKNFNEDDIQWQEIPKINEFDMIIAHWDVAYTDNEWSDYNAVPVWGAKDRKFYKIDNFVKQAKMKNPCDWMCNFKKSVPENTNIIFQYESQFWNEEVDRNITEAEIRNDVDLNIMKVDLPGNKLGRMLKMVPYFQNNRIIYNIAIKNNNDTQVGIMQLCAVEEGSTEHDDSPDADSAAIKSLEKYVMPTRKNSEQDSWKTGKMESPYNVP